MLECSYEVRRRYAADVANRAVVHEMLAADLFKIGRTRVDEGRPEDARKAFAHALRHASGAGPSANVRALTWVAVLSLPTGVRERAGRAFVGLSRALEGPDDAGSPHCREPRVDTVDLGRRHGLQRRGVRRRGTDLDPRPDPSARRGHRRRRRLDRRHGARARALRRRHPRHHAGQHGPRRGAEPRLRRGPRRLHRQVRRRRHLGARQAQPPGPGAAGSPRDRRRLRRRPQLRPGRGRVGPRARRGAPGPARA